MFSENLKTLRKQKGMSQETLAQQLNVVRQTISKWEKGLSVPDADMLTNISELFEVSVSDLLGSNIEKEENINEVAIQLALLNEQLANRTKRNKRIVKTILKVILTLIVVSVVISFLGVALYAVPKTSNTTPYGETYLVCTLNGEEYKYELRYNKNFEIIEAGGDAFISDHTDIDRYTDANQMIAHIEDYFQDHGGTVDRTDIEKN